MRSKENSDINPPRFPIAIDAPASMSTRTTRSKDSRWRKSMRSFRRADARATMRTFTCGNRPAVDDGLGDSPISIYGRNSASGTYGFFKEHALKNGDYKDEVKEQPGSASVVQSVSEDQAGIGYSGIGYLTSNVRAVPLAEKEGAPFKEATSKMRTMGPIPSGAISISMSTKRPTNHWILSSENSSNSSIVKKASKSLVKDGFFPLKADTIEKELKKLD